MTDRCDGGGHRDWGVSMVPDGWRAGRKAAGLSRATLRMARRAAAQEELSLRDWLDHAIREQALRQERRRMCAATFNPRPNRRYF